MNRRAIFKYLIAGGMGALISPVRGNTSLGLLQDNPLVNEKSDREYWVSILSRIAHPILENISKQELRKNMPMEVSPVFDTRDSGVGYLEAFGRLLAGMAPWLSLPDDESAEGILRKKYKEQALLGIQYGLDPNSADYFTW